MVKIEFVRFCHSTALPCSKDQGENIGQILGCFGLVVSEIRIDQI